MPAFTVTSRASFSSENSDTTFVDTTRTVQPLAKSSHTVSRETVLLGGRSPFLNTGASNTPYSVMTINSDNSDVTIVDTFTVLRENKKTIVEVPETRSDSSALRQNVLLGGRTPFFDVGSSGSPYSVTVAVRMGTQTKPDKNT
ncbi:hypothetical protein BCR33DRAFT_851170 [Rhizoclosmatium globosum]|uniref:Uncharacterized protein n=1 Tax=Rhizoclosmatium globosum TaxID=329046 RepID=A0A1Y2C961_9FUNG|nr:hypothetical protein BCR33DRAFT_851170 [Rhizoclosmatium globosum]|eukprot:ORY43447.1 hypothetical protein BCR33DRAFT_851170 [Rhizoclosmatium globosum]